LLTDALVTGAYSAAAGFAAVLVAGALLVADLVTGAAGGAVFFPAAFVAEGFLAGAVRLRAFVACASSKACSISAEIRPREDTSKPAPIAHARISLVVFFVGAPLAAALFVEAFSPTTFFAALFFAVVVSAIVFFAAVLFTFAGSAGAGFACASWKACSISTEIRPREDTSKPAPIAHSRISLVVIFAEPAEPLGDTATLSPHFARQSSNTQ
jgi:hypothetical protein